MVYAVASTGRFAPGEFQRFATTLGAQDTWRSQFDINASPEQAARLDALQSNPDVTRTNALRNFLRNALLTGNATSEVDLDPREWFQRTSARIDLLRGVEATIAEDVAAASQAAQSAATRQALLYSVVLALVLVLTVALSLWLARSMVGPLRTLTRSANEVADERLPGLVDKLHHTKDPRDLDVVPEPVPVNSNDEIGQVSAAFNSVHRVAIQVATEQAALRKSIGDMFLNLARRSQSLIDRQLELIDDLERTEADPDALDNLFKLDHLATRMRRNSEDLIVLSGAEPARRWSQPVPLVDVVRAALAEVEDYNRVELLPIDDIGVAGQAVSDVVHLLAELIENATSFSPPGTKVQVAGQQVSNGYVLEIEDRGLGMSDDELVEANERLANPPMVDFALSRMLGLYVVARLAQRYNIKVQLRHSWYGGITALVLLPPTVAVRAPMPEAIEAPSRRGPAELVPSTKPVEPAAEETGDHLPIFEAARSDWFEDSVRGDHLPLRRHAAQQPNGRAAEPTGNGAGTLDGAGAARTPSSGPGGFGFGASRPAGPDDPTRPQPDGADGNQDRRGPDRCRQSRGHAGGGDADRGRPDGGGRRRGGQGRGAPEQAARPRRRPGRPPGPTGRLRTGTGRQGPHRTAADPDPRGVGAAAGRGRAVRARGAAERRRPRRRNPAGRAAAPPAPAGPGPTAAPGRTGPRPARPPPPRPPAPPGSPDRPQASRRRRPPPRRRRSRRPRSRRPRPASPAGSRGRTSPPGWWPRRPRRPPRGRPTTAPNHPPPRPGLRRRSGACCRATARASSAAG